MYPFTENLNRRYAFFAREKRSYLCLYRENQRASYNYLHRRWINGGCKELTEGKLGYDVVTLSSIKVDEDVRYGKIADNVLSLDINAMSIIG